MGTGLKNATASLCLELRDRIQWDRSDPEHIKGAWVTRAYDSERGEWLSWSPASSGSFGGQVATVMAYTQVSVPPVTKVQFRVTLTNGSGSTTQTVTVNVV